MWNTSVIDGPIPVPTALDGDGSPTAFDPRYHLNLAASVFTEAWAPYRIEPASPARVWAGDDAPYLETVFLRFADEAAARAVMGDWWL